MITYHLIDKEIRQGEELSHKQGYPSWYCRERNRKAHHGNDNNRNTWEVVLEEKRSRRAIHYENDSDGIISECMSLIVKEVC